MAVWFGDIVPVTGTTVTETGIPFAPVAVIFFGVHNALTNISQTFGAASGSSDQWSMWAGVRQQTATYDGRHRELRDTCCINLYSLTDHTTLQSRGVLTALTSDGFSVAFTGAGGTVQPIFYMAIGGLNINAAHAGTFLATTSTGTIAETGVGFRPKALVVGHTIATALNSQQGGMVWGLGFTDSSNHFSCMVHAPQGTATAADHIQRTDAVACSYIPANGMYLLELDSMDSDGFTVNVVDAWPSNIQHGYLAIDAAAAVVGTSEFPDSTGTVSYSTPGMEPGGVLFGWNGADTPASSGSSTGPVRIGVGGMDGLEINPTKDDAGAISGLHRNSAPFGSYQPKQDWRDTDAVHIVGAGSQVDPTAATLYSAGAFSLFDMGEFQLNWTTATSNSREFGWLALPGELLAPWIPQIYRLLVTA